MSVETQIETDDRPEPPIGARVSPGHEERPGYRLAFYILVGAGTVYLVCVFLGLFKL